MLVDILKFVKLKKLQKHKYSCDICQKSFLLKSKLERHTVTHSRTIFEYYSKRFKREDHYISHQTIVNFIFQKSQQSRQW